MIIGAFARDIWFKHQYGLNPSRRTFDIDLAAIVDSWGAFEQFRDHLVQHEQFRKHCDPGQPQRLLATNGPPLDVLPFGGIEEQIGSAERMIRWPVDSTLMSVLGFHEAFATAQTFILPGENKHREIRVLTIPSLVLLKLIAWKEREEDKRRRKHVSDIYFVMTKYAAISGGSENHRIPDEQPGDEIEWGAFLLGADIRAVIGEAARNHVIQILKHEVNSRSRCQLVKDLQRQCGGQFAAARSLLAKLLQGLTLSAEGTKP